MRVALSGFLCASVAVVAAAPVVLGEVGTVLLVVGNSSSLDTQESARRSLLQSWGYTVVPISATASQSSFDSAVLTSSVAYIVETIISSDLGVKLVNAPIGVVCEEAALSDEFGFSSTFTSVTSAQINVTDGTHSITSTVGTGIKSLFVAAQPVRYLSGTLGGFTTLGQTVVGSYPALAVMERGATMTPSGTAAGRRVYLPWGNTGVDLNSLTADGQTIMRRALAWCLLPVAHWKLDDASGSLVSESIAGRNGTQSGATWATGRLTGALSFNGSTSTVTVSDDPAFRVTSAITVAGWIRGLSWNSDGNWASPILRKGDANPTNWQLYVSLGRAKIHFNDYDLYGISGNTTLATNRWYHVAGTWDGQYVRVYVDGVLDMTPVAFVGPIGTDTRPVYLGGRAGLTDVTNGAVDDVRLYSRALTPAEIADLAKASPLIASWRDIAP